MIDGNRRNLPRPKMIIALFPELLSKGGIQRMSQNVCAVLQEFADDLGDTCELLSLNDPEGLHQLEVAGRRFVVRGFAKRKSRFVWTLLSRCFRTRILYLGHPNFAPLGLLCKFLNSRVRFVVSAYGLEVWNPLSAFHKRGLQRASAITSISEFTARKLIEVQGVDPARVEVIPCVINAELLHANGNGAQPDAKRGAQKILLAVGRLDTRERHKGLDEVILALPQLTDAVPELVFVIAGDGDDRNRLEELARNRGLSHRVIFKGVVSDEELIELYEGCDVFLMPSSQEGFGIVFLEAMAFKKPVIGGNHGGTPEVILDNETGFLVEHGDVDSLADRIATLLSDPELCKRMGEAGRRRVEENYTFEPLHRKLRGLFAKLRS
jgi:glycosyltransferase involved in cell wall biosynthesis